MRNPIANVVDSEGLREHLARRNARRLVFVDHLLRRRAAERLPSDFAAWNGEPVYAYGFEDLTGAQWALLEALAGRTDVSASLPYEPGRPAFAALRQTAEDLAGLAEGVEELPPNYAAVAPPALVHLERTLFADQPRDAPPLDGVPRPPVEGGERPSVEGGPVGLG